TPRRTLRHITVGRYTPRKGSTSLAPLHNRWPQSDLARINGGSKSSRRLGRVPPASHGLARRQLPETVVIAPESIQQSPPAGSFGSLSGGQPQPFFLILWHPRSAPSQ